MARKSYEISDAQIEQIEKQETIEETPKKDKSANFKRLAGNRLNKAVHDIELLENLSNKNTYTYSEEQIEFIFKALDVAVANVRKAFEPKTAEAKKEKLVIPD